MNHRSGFARPFPHAVVTGFRPFLEIGENPSALLVDSVADDAAFSQEARVRLETRLLDTVSAGLREQLDALLANAPAMLVLTGYSALARGFKIETSATDLRSPDFADASGWSPPAARDPVTARANAAVDFPGLVDALRGAGVGGDLSDDAGEYVCNHAYWHALDLIARRGLATRALFLHLPAVAGMQNPLLGAATMELADMRRGLAAVLRELASSGRSGGCG